METYYFDWLDPLNFLLPGLILGGSLILFVCFLINECDYPPVQPTLSIFHPSYYERQQERGGVGVGDGGINYSYGWSFVLAVVAFLSAEVAAVLCLTAFIQRFDSEVSN